MFSFSTVTGQWHIKVFRGPNPVRNLRGGGQFTPFLHARDLQYAPTVAATS